MRETIGYRGYADTIEAAGVAGVSPRTVQRWIREQRLPAKRTSPGRGGRWRVRLDDLERLLAGEMPGLVVR